MTQIPGRCFYSVNPYRIFVDNAVLAAGIKVSTQSLVQAMHDSSADRDELDCLAEEFVAEVRAGKRPLLTDYIQRLPERADEIRDLFPALIEIEQLKPLTSDHTGDFIPSSGTTDPDRIGEFRILRCVGNGGMGVVYEAVQESLGRHVALKLLPLDALADPKRLERFRREAKSAARLHHTNIVPVFGTGEAGGRHYYAMQFICGHPLDEVINELRLCQKNADSEIRRTATQDAVASILKAFSGEEPASDAPQSTHLGENSQGGKSNSLSDSSRGYWSMVARITSQVADALSYAHGQGILHRDIKPANLLLDLQGIVWVTDFGLAKTTDAEDLTQAGDIVGTIRYMAPERFDGVGDHRVDIYALGLTLYELLTLRPAFSSHQRPKLLEQVMAANPPKPRSINPSIPRDLETIVLKAIARDPALRYQTASEMAEDLRRYIEDRPIRARRASTAEMAFRWCRRNPAVAMLIAAVLLTTTIGSITASVFALRARSLAEIAAENARVAGEQRDRAQEAELEGRYKLFEAYLSEAKANRLARRRGQRFETLARVSEAATIGRELGVSEDRIAELRQIAITALSVPDIYPRFLGEIPSDLYCSNVSNDLTKVMFLAKDNSLTIRAVESGQVLAHLPPITTPNEGIAYGYFSPDGRRVLRYVPEVDSPVELWDISSPEVRLLRSDNCSICRHQFRPDSKVLAFSFKKGGMLIWDAETGDELHRMPQIHGEILARVALHPQLPLVLSCSYSSRRIYIRDYHTGDTVHTLDPPWEMGTLAAIWHPDGRRIFAGCGDTDELQEYQFDPSTRVVTPGRKLKSNAHGGVVLAINSAGDRLWTHGWGMYPGLIDLETGRVLLSVAKMPFFGDLRFTSDDRSVIGTVGLPQGRSSYGVFDIGDSREVRTIRTTITDGDSVIVHPNGRLALIPQYSRYTLVDLEGLQELGTIERGSYRTINAAFDAAGNLYTNSFEGAFRWPVSVDSKTVTIGLPERLPLNVGSEEIDVSADGKTIAQAQFLGYGMQRWAGGWILTPDRPHDPIYVAPGIGQSRAKVSSDGELICLGEHAGLTRIFNSHTGQMIWQDSELVIGYRPQFTPDDRWLVGGYGAVRVGEWDKHVTLDPSRTAELHAVSPDSRYALLFMSEGYLRLVEIATGRELARIEPPDGRVGMFTFTPDGTRLLEPSLEGLRVWDLRLIRSKLGEIGLDWDAPPFPEKSPAPAKPPLELNFRGRDLLANPGKLATYENTVTLFRMALNPFDPDARLFLGRKALTANQPAEALGHFRIALWSRPESYTLRVNSALALSRMNQYATAAEEYTAAIRVRPDDYRVRYWRADAYRRIGQFERAAEDLTTVLDYFPDDAEIYENRADCYAALGDDVRAQADRATANRFIPRSAIGLNNRAWRLVTGPPASRDPKKALELILKAVEIDPEESLYQNTLGVALYRNQRYTEAIVALEKSIASSKGMSDGFDLYFLTMCYTLSGDLSRGQECFKRAVEWMKQQKNLTPQEREELNSFQSEAEEILRQAETGKS